MDHFPLPRDCEPLDIKIPYVAEAAAQYDGKSLKTFPIRQGYARKTGSFFTLAEIVGYPAQDAGAFVQSWLYFGLLRDVLGTDIWQQAEIKRSFVTISEDSDMGKRINSKPLLSLLDRKEKALASTFTNVSKERHRIRKSLVFASKQCLMLDKDCNIPFWPEILLSIRVLIDSLTHLSYCPSDYHWYNVHDEGGSGPNYSSRLSVKLVESRLRGRHGWCVHQVRRMCHETKTAVGLVYLASIRRHPASWIKHGQCDDKKHCMAYNVDDSFKGVHVDDKCTCTNVLAPEKDMFKILDNGEFPIVRSTIDESGKIRLEYLTATTKSCYTAISHLWADGLANHHGNSLPECQLRRLILRIRDAQKRTVTLRDRVQQNVSVDFWLDVYCVPVPVQRDPVPGEVARTVENLSDLKQRALKKMTATYAWAKNILVLDHELRAITAYHDELELRGRVAICGWNSRYWTFHEACLSRDTIFQTGDGPRREFEGRYPFLRPSRNKETLYETLHRDIFRAGRAIQIVTGARRPCVVSESANMSSGTQRYHQFEDIWQAFVYRNTTKLTDALGIFAALLGTDPSGILKLPDNDRMKALLASQDKIPLSILFADVPRHEAPEDSWIPKSPKGVVLDFNYLMERARGPRQTLGWKLTYGPNSANASSAFAALSDLRYVVCFRPHPRGWTLDTGGEEIWSLDGDAKYQIQPHNLQISRKALAGIEESVIVVLQPAAGSTEMSPRNGHGACLLPAGHDDKILFVRYGFSLSWFKKDSCEQAGKVDPVACPASPIVHQTETIILACDVDSWPPLLQWPAKEKLSVDYNFNVSIRRFEAEELEHSPRGIVLEVAGCAWCAALFIIVVFGVKGWLTSKRGLSAIVLCSLFLGAPLLVWLVRILVWYPLPRFKLRFGGKWQSNSAYMKRLLQAWGG